MPKLKKVLTNQVMRELELLAFDLKNVAQADVDTTQKPKDEAEAEKIPDADFDSLIERFKQVLGERVTDVRASTRLYQSVAACQSRQQHECRYAARLQISRQRI
ncbi:hypothetical protein [Candidatus Villigracilis affinis]|uniref:hypothetical protein n=1 Tax=Candidatus Villigracilis affinis TaxID=3140682 RepID=UPI002A213BA2|nr:hypothetical protein [Anaerolineales bacterium]